MSTTIVFFEKPGCIGNQDQKKVLRERGYSLIVKDLLSHPWQIEELKKFFNQKPVPEWFNLSAPEIKSGQIKVDSIDADSALKMMLDNPILIKRPLLSYQKKKQCGFISGPVFDQLGIQIDNAQKLQDCPVMNKKINRETLA